MVNSNGVQVILNTRTSAALSEAGIPISEWSGTNVTGLQVPGLPAGTTFDDLAASQLTKNNLPPDGIPTLPTVK